MTNEWPVSTIVFREPPTVEMWELFSARVAEELGCIGIEEKSVGPRELMNLVPPWAKLYFPRPDDGSVAPDRTAEITSLGEECFDANTFAVSSEGIPNQDWGVNWRKYFKTFRVGQQLYVGPPWEGKLPADAPPDAKLILIEPGQAFGTGSHETTQLCLQLVERTAKPGAVILDVGAGSGILGIGALHLGASYAIGVEYDPVCEENFLLNAGLNGFADRMAFVLSGDPAAAMVMVRERKLPEPDFILCNMLSERFIPLLGALHSIGLPIVFSGYLVSEAHKVKSLVTQAGFKIETMFELEEWGACLCRVG